MLCRCYLSLTLPHGAMGWPVVCDCGIFCSYSLTFISLPTPVVSAAGRSKAEVLLLFTRCLPLLP